MDSKLSKQQKSALNILETVVPIIEKHNLRYSMLGGTLLGAVRHKGFIPWDDDIDIGLPRPDYEKFIQIAENELSAPLELQSALKGNGHYCYFRIVDTETKLVRTAGLKDSIINVWIDVFPLDGVPNGLAGNLWKLLASAASDLFGASEFSYRSPKDGLGDRHGFVRVTFRKAFKKFNLERFLDSQKCARFLNNILKSSDYDHCDKVWNFMGYWKEKEIFPREIYENMVRYPFEDMELYGPQNFDFVLTQMYGDYMTPPKEEERDHHMTSMIE